MLLRALFLIFLFGLLIETSLGITGVFANTVVYDRALSYVPAAYQTGLATISQSFATGAFVAPAPAAPLCASNDTPCSFYASVTIAQTAQTAPASGTACGGPALTNCAANLQKQAIDETRLALRVSIVISDASRHPLVARTKFVTLRTFGVAPYFALIGERDGSNGDRSTAPEGEDAGAPASTSQASTQIKVQYHDSTGKTPDREVDAWATQGWSSGNGSMSTWSP